jgi:pyruvate formate lyase activating enzyme
MQGCPMRCLYCHNPDTWAIGKGDLRSAEDILSEYDGVKEFLKDGGLTVSGGEPLVQTAFVTELFEKAKAKGIHTCLDTSGILFTPENTEMFDRLIKSTDLVLLDIKHIDSEKHRWLTGHSNENILDCARYLSDIEKPVWIRHVLVPGITDDEEQLKQLRQTLDTLKNIKKVEVLPYHTLGTFKWKQLGIPYSLEDVPTPTNEQVARAREILTT